MKRRILVGFTVIAALATAALVRPPRATPAFSPPSAACTACHPGLSARQPAEPQDRHRTSHLRRSKAHGDRRRPHRPRPPIVDVNRADEATLERVPGVSQELARRIVAFRALVGSFSSLDDLSDLDGLSENRIMTLSRYLVVRE